MKVFVSYSHQQGAWVRDALVPVLRASGADVLVDWERFKAGFAVAGQMDGTQDKADRLRPGPHQLTTWRANIALHEMDRRDPGSTPASRGQDIPSSSTPSSAKITRPNPLRRPANARRDQWH